MEEEVEWIIWIRVENVTLWSVLTDNIDSTVWTILNNTTNLCGTVPDQLGKVTITVEGVIIWVSVTVVSVFSVPQVDCLNSGNGTISQVLTVIETSSVRVDQSTRTDIAISALQ